MGEFLVFWVKAAKKFEYYEVLTKLAKSCFPPSAWARLPAVSLANFSNLDILATGFAEDGAIYWLVFATFCRFFYTVAVPCKQSGN